MFYICLNGKLTKHDFSYLLQDNKTHRLDKTLSPGDTQLRRRSSDAKNHFAIEVMTKSPFTSTKDVRLPEIQKLMSDNDIRHIPILDESEQVCGMISDRDLIKLDTSAGFNFLKAHEVMSDIVICADEDVSLPQLSQVLAKEKVSAIPILNKSLKIVGIISYIDVLEALVDHHLIV